MSQSKDGRKKVKPAASKKRARKAPRNISPKIDSDSHLDESDGSENPRPSKKGKAIDVDSSLATSDSADDLQYLHYPAFGRRAMMLRETLWDKGEAERSRLEAVFPTTKVPYGLPHSDCDDEKDLRFDFIETEIDSKMLDLTKALDWTMASLKYGAPGRSILPSFDKNQILVIADYEAIYKDFVESGVEADLIAMNSAAKKKEHALILGNSGIGKSVLLNYMLVRRLLEGKPTLFRTASESFLYTQLGVIWDDADIAKEFEKLDAAGVEVWVLCDRMAPLAKDQDMVNARLIEATSLEVAAYGSWEKALAPKMYFMDLWSWEEIYLLKEFYEFPLRTPRGMLTENDFIKRLWMAYFKHGGEPRLFMVTLRVFSTGDEFHQLWAYHQQRVKRACIDGAHRDFQRTGLFGFHEHKDSHLMIASRPPLRRLNGKVVASTKDKRPACSGLEPDNDARTAWVAGIFAKELVRVNRSVAMDMVDSMIHFSDGKTLAGHIKEQVDHELFEKAPMKKLVGSSCETDHG
ncbi:hypothetical protein BJ508DRAFT_329697 [Ascobolus immersus RN42]|uniref:Uncharacterized protein n=1 Tax=Ascobolus immersus RN42 TaxID=1160509 RepID=A0A3N4HZM7_ASCIM|nr:hypothetical protein BJ508DRAFT_329697 [Ascobolus immersus RN42]